MTTLPTIIPDGSSFNVFTFENRALIAQAIEAAADYMSRRDDFIRRLAMMPPMPPTPGGGKGEVRIGIVESYSGNGVNGDRLYNILDKATGAPVGTGILPYQIDHPAVNVIPAPPGTDVLYWLAPEDPFSNTVHMIALKENYSSAACIQEEPLPIFQPAQAPSAPQTSTPPAPSIPQDMLDWLIANAAKLRGVATMTAGAVTVSTTAVTANSQIHLTPQNTSGTAGSVYVSARVAGTSFTITSTSGTDTRDVAWLLI